MSTPSGPSHDCTVLVLQGGGALGAYQAGAYEALAEARVEPHWVAGVSIGGINGALIAGNRPENRVARLREFWNLVSSGIPIVRPASLDPLRLAFNRVSSAATVLYGVPGMFKPRVPPPPFWPDGTPEALSVYDTSPLRETLLELVDFDVLNARRVRYSAGAVNVRTGNSTYFDNSDAQLVLAPEHIMASGALPPGLPPVRIGEDDFWDGGLVSNTPLSYVLDADPELEALIFQVDLFSARGAMPRNLDEVLERSKDIQYSSRTRFNTTRVEEAESLQLAVHELHESLPQRARTQTESAREPCRISIVHLINRRSRYSLESKDYEFSRATVQAHWEAGQRAVRTTLANPAWLHACRSQSGVRTFDLAT